MLCQRNEARETKQDASQDRKTYGTLRTDKNGILRKDWVNNVGEKIEFPKNYELYLKQAMEQFNAGNMQEAAYYFKDAYSIEQDKTINTFYVTALYQIGDYRKAKEIADTQFAFYQSEERLYAFYTSVLIKAHFFDQATLIIKKELAKMKNLDSIAVWQALSEMNANEKAEDKLRKAKRHQEILENAFSMGNQPFEKQAQTIKEIETLPLDLFIKAAKTLLANPFVNGIAKASVIEHLILHQIDEPFTIDWFTEQRTVVPINLTMLTRNKTVQNVEDLLKEEIENDDPVLYQAIHQEANLHFMLLHPFVDEVIASPSYWIDLYRERYEPDYQAKAVDSTTHLLMKEWMEKLNVEIQGWI